MSRRSSLLHADFSESPPPGHVAAPAPPQPLALHPDPCDLYHPSPMDANLWSRIADVRRPEPRGRAGVNFGEETNFRTGAPARSEKKRMKVEKLGTSLDRSIPPAASLSKWLWIIYLAGTHWLYCTLLKDPFSPRVQHPPPLLVHPLIWWRWEGGREFWRDETHNEAGFGA